MSYAPYEPSGETGPMEVVRVLPHGEAMLLGHCDRFSLRPGDVVRVREPVRWADWDVSFDPTTAPQIGHFKTILVRSRWQQWTAIEVTDTSPPIEWLPGWRSVRKAGV